MKKEIGRLAIGICKLQSIASSVSNEFDRALLRFKFGLITIAKR